MKKVILLSAALVMVACGLEEIGRMPMGGAGSIWMRPGGNSGSADKTCIYLTAVDYPDGYDWRSDVEKGSVKCSLVVYADGMPVMKVPVGDSYETSSDPDMHRMVNGNLYTDYSTEEETVIKRNGEEIIRYSGREMICSLVEKGDDIYTLGHGRDCGGFSYRRNGDILFGREKGLSFGRLCQEGDSISFAFYESVSAADEIMERYYHVVNGHISQTAVREDVKKVWDIVSLSGEIYYLASVVGISSPVLIHGDSMQALKMPQSTEILTCRIIRKEKTFFIEGLCKSGKASVSSCLWREDGQIFLFAQDKTVSAICAGGDGVCFTLNSTSPQVQGSIYRFGEHFFMPPGYVSVGSGSASVISGILHVGLSSLSSARPLIWKDGDTSSLNINGYISTISTNRE